MGRKLEWYQPIRVVHVKRIIFRFSAKTYKGTVLQPKDYCAILDRKLTGINVIHPRRLHSLLHDKAYYVSWE